MQTHFDPILDAFEDNRVRLDPRTLLTLPVKANFDNIILSFSKYGVGCDGCPTDLAWLGKGCDAWMAKPMAGLVASVAQDAQASAQPGGQSS